MSFAVVSSSDVGTPDFRGLLGNSGPRDGFPTQTHTRKLVHGVDTCGGSYHTSLVTDVDVLHLDLRKMSPTSRSRPRGGGSNAENQYRTVSRLHGGIAAHCSMSLSSVSSHALNRACGMPWTYRCWWLARAVFGQWGPTYLPLGTLSYWHALSLTSWSNSVIEYHDVWCSIFAAVYNKSSIENILILGILAYTLYFYSAALYVNST